MGDVLQNPAAAQVSSILRRRTHTHHHAYTAPRALFRLSPPMPPWLPALVQCAPQHHVCLALPAAHATAVLLLAPSAPCSDWKQQVPPYIVPSIQFQF